MEKNKITETVNEYIDGKDLFLVDVKCSASNVIEVVVDSMHGVDIDTCVDLSRFIESRFDRDKEDYELTVSSASSSDPFSLPQQYRKNIGREVEVWINGEAAGEKTDIKRTGIITGAGDDNFTLSYTVKEAVEGKKKKETREVNEVIMYGDVRSTRLIIKF